METRQNTNDFAKGMTNIPSDNICPDDSVAAEWNMIFRNGEHCPIQAPVNPFVGQVENSRTNMQLLYVHNHNDLKRCIFYDVINEYVYWAFFNYINTPAVLIDSFKIKRKEITGITSIGNTLIISLSTEGHSSLHYFLWKPELSDNTGNYRFIGTRLPEPNIDFRLFHSFAASSDQKTDGILETTSNHGPQLVNSLDETQLNFNTLVIGLYSKNKNEISKSKMFHSPFCLRYAIKLYDGSYTFISTPILMFPSVTQSTYAESYVHYLSLTTFSHYLQFYLNESLSEWQDIIKAITIFITRQVEIYDLSKDQEISYNKNSQLLVHDAIFSEISNPLSIFKEGYFNSYSESDEFYSCYSHMLVKRSANDIVNDLINNSVFYKLCDIELSVSNGIWNHVGNYIESNHLENIETAEQLDHDDYYSKCPLMAKGLFVYNKRLHLANVSRGFYEGAKLFLPLQTIEYNIVDRITIKSSDGLRVILHKYRTKENPSLYYYYPDPRAIKVDRCIGITGTNGSLMLGIIKIGDVSCSFDLKPHPTLNGAYYMRKQLPSISDNLNWTSASSIQYTIPSDPTFSTENVTPEQLQNEVWVSEVNNPFVFNASGVNTVGNGSIIGIISNTQALSQGQFGQFPLFCFTTDGVWTLQTSSEGTYSSAHPISREICNNKDSITATDNLVFFSSEKGLMMINGSEVSCVSSQLSGKTYVPTPKEIMYHMANIEPVSFVDFIKKCKIAYDYRDNLLWIVNPNYRHCFLLSIESGAYAMTTLRGYPVNVINDYPDTLIEVDYGQTEPEYMTFSLINRPNINDDERRISSFIISRPMKIGDQNSLKTPTMIRYIGNNNQKAVLKMRLFASDDLINWVRINSLRGRGFKYYKYNFIFEDLLPTDTFSGVTERWQFKYLSKFR